MVPVNARSRAARARTGARATVALVLLGALCVAIPPAVSAQGEAPEPIKVSPASPVQGDTLIVIIAALPPATVRVRFDGDAIPVFSLPDGQRRVLIGTTPDVATGAHTLSVTVTEGSKTPQHYSQTVRIRSGHFGARSLTLPPGTMNLISTKNLDTEWRALGPVLARRTPVAYWSGPFQVPATSPIDSPYGLESVYNGHREWWHQGADFAGAEGDPVVAVNAGVVALAQNLPLGGNTVVIDHGQGVLSEFIHLSSFTVHPGDRVARGALIGRIGATGLVTGPSLHWGLYVNGRWVNPLFWLDPHPGLTS